MESFCLHSSEVIPCSYTGGMKLSRFEGGLQKARGYVLTGAKNLPSYGLDGRLYSGGSGNRRRKYSPVDTVRKLCIPNIV